MSIENEFEKWWLADSVPCPYGRGDGLYSPASLAVTRRKEAAKLAYKEGRKNDKLEFELDAFGGWLIEMKCPTSVLEKFRLARKAAK